MISPAENTFLIADPFLKDDNFLRSVIYLCNHNKEGSFGLILNKPFEFTLNQLITGIESHPIPVCMGGPVGLDTIHFLHQYHDEIPDSQRLSDDVSWGGDFETVKNMILLNQIDLEKIKFFIGYSGWTANQLENEIEEKTWLTSTASRNIIFNTSTTDIWKKSILALGSDYEQLANYPIDPQLN